jgi:hypothetical protein
MAQHDYVIDNQAFPATRADINSVLQAIVSNNSGSSAPSTTFANQIWYDSSANILYMRNEDNDANIPLLQLNQTNDLAITLATVIAILDASGTNTAGTDLTIMAGAGTGTGAGGNIILQTANAGSSGSSANSHATAVTVDDGGQVGIGTTPTAQLHISGDDVSNQVIIENTSTAADNAPDLLLKRNSASPADDDEVGQIVFQGRNDNSQFPTLATMRVIYKDVTDTTEDAALVYELMTGGTKSEVMRIEGGTLLIGKTSTGIANVGHQMQSNGLAQHVADGAISLQLNRKSSDGAIAQFRKDGTTVGSIGSRSGVVSFIVLDPRSGGSGLSASGTAVLPANENGATVNNTIDLGDSNSRFKGLYIGDDIAHLDNGGNARLLYDKSSNLLGNAGTNVTCATLSKSSGSFKIDHPLESKSDTHHLVHSFVEAPQADNIYRGTVDLVGGSATINLDTEAGMTEGTFVALNREVQCFTSNETGWTAIKGSVSGNTLTITAQDNTCTDTISWLVIGERKDAHMLNTDWTDDNGKVIVEPLKPVDEDTSTSSETTDEGTSTSSDGDE